MPKATSRVLQTHLLLNEIKQKEDYKFHNASCRQDFKTDRTVKVLLGHRNEYCRQRLFLSAPLLITQLWREMMYAHTDNLPPINGTSQHKSPLQSRKSTDLHQILDDSLWSTPDESSTLEM